MVPDFAVQMIEATVMIEQDLGQGTKTIGTGFLVSDRDERGRPVVVLVTAEHVLEEMSRPRVSVGFRVKSENLSWTYAPSGVDIRDAAGRPLWTSHPMADVAAISIAAPAELAAKAIPIAYLSDEPTQSDIILPGGEMLALGYPRGLSANSAGFPILRSGRIASYPLEPAASLTFLMDFSVFPGNSGGPVFSSGGRGMSSAGHFMGMLTQQVEVGHERLDIGIVTHAVYIRQTLDLVSGRADAAQFVNAALAPDPGRGEARVARNAVAEERP